MSSYEAMIKNKMNEISPNIYDNCDRILEISTDAQNRILQYLIECSCQGQNIAPIQLARKQLRDIPSEWMKEKIPVIAEVVIDFDDEWEFRRLSEVIEEFIPQLSHWLISKVEDSNNDEIHEAVIDYLERTRL